MDPWLLIILIIIGVLLIVVGLLLIAGKKDLVKKIFLPIMAVFGSLTGGGKLSSKSAPDVAREDKRIKEKRKEPRKESDASKRQMEVPGAGQEPTRAPGAVDDVSFTEHGPHIDDNIADDEIVPGSRGGEIVDAEPKADPVHLGASAPQAVRPGNEFIARFAAYTPDEEQQVAALLKALSPDAKTHLGLRECRWQPGTRATVRLNSRSPHLEIDEAEQEFVWQGKRILLDFGVYVAEGAPNISTSLKFSVAIDGIVVASFRLGLTITVDTTTPERATATAEPAHSAFASYASKDRQRVLDRVAAVRIAAGLDIFLDCLSLNPGDRWKDRRGRSTRPSRSSSGRANASC